METKIISASLGQAIYLNLYIKINYILIKDNYKNVKSINLKKSRPIHFVYDYVI